MPYAATIFAPEFVRLQRHELAALLNVLRSPLATQIFLILVSQADFKTGWALVSYARLMACRPFAHPGAPRCGRPDRRGHREAQRREKRRPGDAPSASETTHKAAERKGTSSGLVSRLLSRAVDSFR